ncbi:MAG: hypothetical protein PVJ83_08450 [Gammaproteobacteria bacterium]|jgi:hypothetical protein
MYLPGGSWRGYDPGHGGAVANAAPIEGSFYRAGASSSLDHELVIRTRP